MRMICSWPREATVSAFTADHIAAAPAATGVYFLYRHGRIIYIGVAVHGSSIRRELERHLEGAYGAPTQAATSFDYEVTRDPVVASDEYLRMHMERHGGRVPSCNAAGS